jgi:hypothetical protein
MFERDFFYSGIDEDEFNKALDKKYKYIASLQIVTFFKKWNNETRKNEWNGRQRTREGTTIYVANSNNTPTANGEVWLVSEQEVITDNPEHKLKVVSAELVTKIFDGDCSLQFTQDRRGRWNCPVYPSHGLKIICGVDKYGIQPSEDRPFWKARFVKVVDKGADGDYFILIMNLLTEDVAAKEEHLALLKAAEEERVAREKAAEEERKAQAKRDEEAMARWSESKARHDALEKAQDELEQKDPELAQKLRNLERLDRENQGMTRTALPRQHYVGGGIRKIRRW